MKILTENKTQSIQDLGRFTVQSGAIRFTDPCYGNEVWCKGSMPAVNGTYETRIGFFRDRHDEESIFNEVELLKKTITYVEGMKTSADLEFFKTLHKSVVEQQKAANVFGGLPYSQINYPDEAKELIADIIEFTNTLKKPSWSEPENFIQSQIDSILEGVVGCKREALHLSLQVGLASSRSKHKESLTDQGIFEVEKAEVSQGLKLLFLQRVSIYGSGKPRRTHFLHIKHDSVPAYTSFDEDVWTCNETFNVGVDSGQAGFFDEQWYANYANTKESDEEAWGKTYEMLCCLSSGGDGSKREGGVCEFGANSYTAYGDGFAPLFYRANDKGEVIEAVYHYDADWNEEEDDVE
jgi:hypothetical protein